jgi:hypothetical protein
MLPALLLLATSALALATTPRALLNDNVLIERSAMLNPRQLADIPQGVQLLNYWPRIHCPGGRRLPGGRAASVELVSLALLSRVDLGLMILRSCPL